MRVVVMDLLKSEAPPIGLGTFVFGDRARGIPKLDNKLQLDDSVASESSEDGGFRRHVRRFEVPAGAALELAGEVLCGTDCGTATSLFTVAINGEEILRKRVEIEGETKTFLETVSLEASEGQTIELALSSDNQENPNAVAWWTAAWVVRLDTVPRQKASAGRNLLFVTVDTLRADHLGLYGYHREVSPNLDRFSEDSLVFDRAISPTSWTQPAVASLLTGLSPMQHGVTGGTALPWDLTTLGEELQGAGFTTAAFSTNPIISEREGFHRGFETFRSIPWQTGPGLNASFGEWLRNNRERRWFAYLQYIDPHDPYNAPGSAGKAFVKDYQGPFKDPATRTGAYHFNSDPTVPPPTEKDLEYLRDRYDGEILFWDQAFGDLLEILQNEGVLQNTIVIFVGDHGEEFFEHGKILHGLQLYDESIRVPAIVRAPDLVEPGRRPQQLGTQQLYDVALHLTGVGAADEALQGVLESSTAPESPAFSQTSLGLTDLRTDYQFLASVRMDGWKYILRLNDGANELYDLSVDPGETQNRVEREPSRARAYDELLRGWLSEDNRREGAQWTDPGMVEKLRSLGYIR